jgi:hypothetical protein
LGAHTAFTLDRRGRCDARYAEADIVSASTDQRVARRASGPQCEALLVSFASPLPATLLIGKTEAGFLIDVLRE